MAPLTAEFTYFHTHVLLLPQDPIQGTMRPLSQSLLSLLWSIVVSQTDLVFDDLDSFEKYWSGVL